MMSLQWTVELNAAIMYGGHLLGLYSVAIQAANLAM